VTCSKAQRNSECERLLQFLTVPSIAPAAPVFVALSLILVQGLHSQEKVGSPSSQQAGAQYAYPNTADGLGRLLQDMVAAAKGNDQARLTALIKQTEIPSYETWFTTTFGQQTGEKMGHDYGRLLDKNEKDFKEFWMQLARQDGQIFTLRLDEALQRKQYATLTHVLAFYFANWKRSETPKDAKRDPVGYFIYLDGQFRWHSLVEFMRDQHPATLISRVSPNYPPEAKARGIQGQVAVEVIIGKNGSVSALQLLSGDPLLAPAAMEAVRQWRYQPLLVNGQPVPIRTTITVNFTLSQ
jgi:TonB family protein